MQIALEATNARVRWNAQHGLMDRAAWVDVPTNATGQIRTAHLRIPQACLRIAINRRPRGHAAGSERY